MKQILAICKFTFIDAVRKKAFIISTIIIFLLIIGLCAIPGIINFLDNSESNTIDQEGTVAEIESQSEKCYYIDNTGELENGMEVLEAAYPQIRFIQGDAGQEESYREEIAEDKNASFVKITSQDGQPFITILTKDFMSGIDASGTADILTKAYISDILRDQGVDTATAKLIQTGLAYTADIAGNMELSGYVIGILLTMMIFFAIYYYGYGVAMSIATEKTSRVMETLVISAKPSRILIGKCLGMGLVGLLQFAGMLAVSVICYLVMIPEGVSLMGMPLSFSAFTVNTAFIIILYFILGYALYAVMNSVSGATVSKIEDLNSAMMPVMLIAMVSFYLGYFSAVSASGSDSILQKIAIYLPFSSPFVVPFKLLNGDIPAMDLVISVGLLVVFIVIITMFSIRMYSVSVLHYGKKLKLRDMR